jgi:ubiquinol-cytochrome c reductase cytochrome c1 subunit
MMNKLKTVLAAAALAASAGTAVPAMASGGADLRLEPAPINRLDAASLQRGARTFVNYCLGCHSAKYFRYNRLTDIGVDAAMIQDNLIFTGRFDTQGGKMEWLPTKIGDTMGIAMPPGEAKAWFGAPPPDLSVEARVRGTDWLYNYFLGFYRDDAAPLGWNNLVFPNVGMPHVLAQLGGTNRLETKVFEGHEEAVGAALAAKGLTLLTPGPKHSYLVKTLAVDVPGTLTPTEYRAAVADLVNFLDYVAEPAKNKRINLGIAVLMFLSLLFVFAYWLKREYWKDVH